MCIREARRFSSMHYLTGRAFFNFFFLKISISLAGGHGKVLVFFQFYRKTIFLVNHLLFPVKFTKSRFGMNLNFV